ncbi:MAG: Rpn family recombination-promoting nuclease/putative transposase, partial [Prevotellaceae bacterium]|nr:Rpn family recombination-promoting nuclease/putative transposase [Prevotellaceae bacterium]
MTNGKNYIRFDWAMKRLLRQKADFVVINGFLSSLLGEKMEIIKVLESEGNKNTEDDKFNRVDILVEDSHGAKIIIEIQNSSEISYFHRILYGASKVITEYIKAEENYKEIVKVYSISIVYFVLGQGKDYVYKGTTEFRGIHENDVLQYYHSKADTLHRFANISEIFPEYYILRVEDFDKAAKTPLDEWIHFLKTTEIPETFTAPGLPEAR